MLSDLRGFQAGNKVAVIVLDKDNKNPTRTTKTQVECEPTALGKEERSEDITPLQPVPPQLILTTFDFLRKLESNGG